MNFLSHPLVVAQPGIPSDLVDSADTTSTSPATSVKNITASLTNVPNVQSSTNSPVNASKIRRLAMGFAIGTVAILVATVGTVLLVARLLLLQRQRLQQQPQQQQRQQPRQQQRQQPQQQQRQQPQQQQRQQLLQRQRLRQLQRRQQRRQQRPQLLQRQRLQQQQLQQQLQQRQRQQLQQQQRPQLLQRQRLQQQQQQRLRQLQRRQQRRQQRPQLLQRQRLQQQLLQQQLQQRQRQQLQKQQRRPLAHRLPRQPLRQQLLVAAVPLSYIFWSFDSNYNDLYNNYNGVGMNSPTFSSPGYTGYGSALSVSSASSQYVLVAAYKNMTYTSFTWELWVNPTTLSTTDSLMLGMCQTPSYSLCLYLMTRSSKPYFAFYGNDCVGSTVVPASQWHHFAFIYDYTNQAQYIYMNGVIECSRTGAGPLLAAGNVSDP
ncbi:unnamed protein product [Rotaria magnacalcarata]